MFEISRRTRFVLGGIVGLNLMVGAAAAAGVVPRPTVTETVAAISDSVPDAEVTPNIVETPVPEETTTVAPPETTVPSTTPPTTAPRRTATTQATTPPTTAVQVTTPPTTAAPAPTSTVPARRNPSSAEINGAIASLRGLLPLTPSEAQARQLGAMVCDAFDAGQTYAQVKATAQQQLSQIPFITVSPSAVDAIARTAVQLFCPGHASKLV